MADAKIDMALDDIIKSNRGGRGNRRGGRGGGFQRQQRGGNNQRGNSRGRINKSNNNRGRGGAVGGRNSFNQRNLNRSNNYRQQRGNRKSFGLSRRNNNAGDKPTSTYNPLSRDVDASKQQQQQTTSNVTTPRKQQGSVFNKIRQTPNSGKNNVTALRRRMVAAQRALNRATKTLAAMPRIRQQRQRILQQPQKLRNIITQNRVSGGAVRKRLGTGGRNIGGRGGARGRGRRAFV